MKKLIAGNWKMNGLRQQLGELDTLREAAPRLAAGIDLLICPPATLLAQAVERAGGAVAIGAQDCHHQDNGAHTGEIAAPMLRDIGASHVILGHSERRADNGETSQMVCRKAEAAWRAGLVAIVCIGETDGEREAGTTLDVLKEQLAGSLPEGTDARNTVVAYEPVWAIGTGKTPTADDVAEVHAFVRAELVARFGQDGAGALPILYGGSVKPGNARELMAVPEVGGALVGGASLKAADFIAICEGAIGA